MNGAGRGLAAEGLVFGLRTQTLSWMSMLPNPGYTAQSQAT